MTEKDVDFAQSMMMSFSKLNQLVKVIEQHSTAISSIEKSLLSKAQTAETEKSSAHLFQLEQKVLRLEAELRARPESERVEKIEGELSKLSNKADLEAVSAIKEALQKNQQEVQSLATSVRDLATSKADCKKVDSLEGALMQTLNKASQDDLSIVVSRVFSIEQKLARIESNFDLKADTDQIDRMSSELQKGVSRELESNEHFIAAAKADKLELEAKLQKLADKVSTEMSAQTDSLQKALSDKLAASDLALAAVDRKIAACLEDAAATRRAITPFLISPSILTQQHLQPGHEVSPLFAPTLLLDRSLWGHIVPPIGWPTVADSVAQRAVGTWLDLLNRVQTLEATSATKADRSSVDKAEASVMEAGRKIDSVEAHVRAVEERLGREKADEHSYTVLQRKVTALEGSWASIHVLQQELAADLNSVRSLIGSQIREGLAGVQGQFKELHEQQRQASAGLESKADKTYVDSGLEGCKSHCIAFVHQSLSQIREDTSLRISEVTERTRAEITLARESLAEEMRAAVKRKMERSDVDELLSGVREDIAQLQADADFVDAIEAAIGGLQSQLDEKIDRGKWKRLKKRLSPMLDAVDDSNRTNQSFRQLRLNSKSSLAEVPPPSKVSFKASLGPARGAGHAVPPRTPHAGFSRPTSASLAGRTVAQPAPSTRPDVSIKSVP